MSRIAYVNGRYLPHAMAGVHVEDRGYQFADGVYEVIALQNGSFVDEDAHLERLGRSLSEVRMAWPMSPRSLRHVIREVVRRNRVAERGFVYLQVTRGVAPRNHAFPGAAESTLVLTARSLPPLDPIAMRRGVSVITPRTSDGHGEISSPFACCPMSSRSSRRSNMARSRLGSWTTLG